MPILYDNPKEVGADRIADAVAAFDLFGGPLIVVDFGTATTFEAISAKGEYLGGAIFPGIDISLDALFARAAALRRVELVEPRHVIGRTTVESMQSGVIYGYTSLVDGMVDRIEAELGEKASVVATGGLSGLITPLSATIEHHEPWLTLHGLRLIYEKNQPPMTPRPRTASAEVTDRAADLQAAHADLEPTATRPASPPRWPAGSCCCASRASWPSPRCRTPAAASSSSPPPRAPPTSTSSPRSASATGSWPPAR